MTGTVLILGASGRFGRACCTAFSAAGWQVRRFDRRQGDLMQAAQGQQVIVNGWNPAYTDWAAEVPALQSQVIAAAQATGATVILPGNVYVFGANTPGPWGATTPHRAQNPLGRIRIEMEASYRRSGVQTILLRAGDFLDTRASGNWFDLVLTKHLARGRFTYPGALDRPHAWAFLPDLARAAVDLAARRHSLPLYNDIAFPGYNLTGAELGAAVAAACTRAVRIGRMSWWPIRLASPVWPMGRHLLEMRYLWDTPHQLEAAKLAELLPGFRATPLAEAIAAALPRDLVQFDVEPDQTMAAGTIG